MRDRGVKLINTVMASVLLFYPGMPLTIRAAESPPPAAERAALIAERVGAAAARRLGEPGACPWDWRTQAALLGRDAGVIFRFVRDRIAYEPYEGVLRGSNGVMVSRAGNAIEQATLLCDMLRAAGHEAVIVRGKLPGAQAQALIEAFAARDAIEDSVLSELEAEDDAQAAFLQETGIPEDLWTGWIDGMDQERAEHDRRIASMHASEFACVTEALTKADAAPGAGPGRKGALLASAAQHAWVRWKAPGATRWTDLDPCFPGAEPGTAFGTGGAPAEKQNPQEVHQLTLRLTLERTTGNKKENEILLEVPIPVAAFVAQPVRFLVVPADQSLPAPAEFVKLPPAEMARRLAAVERFQAHVFVGSRSDASLVFDRSGQTYKVSFGIAESVRGIGRGIGGLLGGAFGGGEKAPASQLTRLWLDLELSGPGGRRRQERVLWDGDPRREASFLTEWHVFAQGQPLSRAYLDWRAMEAAASLAPFLAQTARGNADPQDPAQLGALTPNLNAAMLFALERQAHLARVLAARPPGKRPLVLWSVPNVFVTSTTVIARDSDGTVRNAIDIVWNAVTLLARDDTMAIDTQLALELGVLDTCLEALMLPLSPAQQGPRGATDYFSARRISGRGDLAVVRTADRAAAAMPAYTRRWMASSSPEGTIALTPAGWSEEDPDFFWWEIDPSSGFCVGRGWDGTGQAMTEYGLTLESAVFWALGSALCAVGSATGGNITQAICCSAVGVLGAYLVSSLFINSLLLSHALHSAVIPQLDPCYHLGQATGW